MGISISEPEYEKDGGFISVSIDYDKGKDDCKHSWLESILLGVKRCDKCGKVEKHNK